MEPEELKHSFTETNQLIKGKTMHGQSTINQYTLLRNLGEGAFGKVKLCEHGENYYAVKIYKKGLLRRRKEYFRKPEGGLAVRNALEDVAREIAIMKKFEHINVVKLYEVIDDDVSDKLYMIIDYCEEGPIMDWDPDNLVFFNPRNTGDFSENELRKIVRDIVCGLEYLHSRKIIHRDIKPQNILLTSQFSVKIADFGQAMIFADSDTMSKSIGTYHFFPPESCDPEARGFSGKAADIWAVGLTIYILIYKRLPFWAEYIGDLFEEIENFELCFPEEVEIDPELKDLISRLLEKNPENRIKMFELLQNPWMNRNCNEMRRSIKETITPTSEEIESALKPIRSVIFAKVYGRKWLNKIKNKNK